MSARADGSAIAARQRNGTAAACARHAGCVGWVVMSDTARHHSAGRVPRVLRAILLLFALGGGAAAAVGGGMGGFGAGHPGGSGSGHSAEPHGREFGHGGHFGNRPFVHRDAPVVVVPYPYFYDPYYGYAPYYPPDPYTAYCDPYSPVYAPQYCYWDGP